MAPGLRCTGLLSETWPILPIAAKVAHPNSLISKHFEQNYTLFRIFLDSVAQLPEYSGAPVKLSQCTFRAHRFPFSLSGSIWEHLEGSVWLFRVAELCGYDFQTILHFADVVTGAKSEIQLLP
jgi:hypothetical protein